MTEKYTERQIQRHTHRDRDKHKETVTESEIAAEKNRMEDDKRGREKKTKEAIDKKINIEKKREKTPMQNCEGKKQKRGADHVKNFQHRFYSYVGIDQTQSLKKIT